MGNKRKVMVAETFEGAFNESVFGGVEDVIVGLSDVGARLSIHQI